MTASGGNIGTMTGRLADTRKIYFTETRRVERFDPYVFNEENDAIVAVFSQIGGLPRTPFGGLVHTDALGQSVTRDAAVAGEVFSRLDTNGGWAAELPQATSAGDGVPRAGIGRGPVIDGDNFAAQCGVNGPMRQ